MAKWIKTSDIILIWRPRKSAINKLNKFFSDKINSGTICTGALAPHGAPNPGVIKVFHVYHEQGAVL